MPSDASDRALVASVQPDSQHVAMHRRLASVVLGSAVDELEALALEVRLRTGGADG